MELLTVMLRLVFSISLITLLGEAVTNDTKEWQPHHLRDMGDGLNNQLISSNNLPELDRYRERTRILHDLIRSECRTLSDPSNSRRLKREIIPSRYIIQKTLLEVEMLLYERMIHMLTKCRMETIAKTTSTRSSTDGFIFQTTSPLQSTSSPSTTSSSTTTRSTTGQSTTTIIPTPSECLQAVNLAESWRKDHNGSQLGRNCDTSTMVSSGRLWFRFTGAAGTRLLNTCPPPHSCGAHAGLWSDKALPNNVGVPDEIDVYGSWTNGCKGFTKKISIMRCSHHTNDIIYNYMDDKSCSLSFCGM